jgi:RNA polymerase sigma factor (sigma-70 family)
MSTESHGQETLSPEAVQRLVENHRQFLGFLEKRVESRAAAEDILQDAFVRGIERGGELRGDESVVAWFYRILRNAVIDHYRRRGTAGRAMESFARELEHTSAPHGALQSEICACVLDLLESLKPEYQDALRTVDIGEGSMEDLAARANISAGNAAVRVHRAREALRQRVRTACGTCAEHGCLDCHCKKGAGGCAPAATQ